jgi:hypothetical protein
MKVITTGDQCYQISSSFQLLSAHIDRASWYSKVYGKISELVQGQNFGT